MKQKFFTKARNESLLSDYEGAHLGAVAVLDNRYILAVAHNTAKTNPTQQHYNRYRAFTKHDILCKPARGHAEIGIYRKIRYLDVDFSKVEIYIYRELKNGALALARPCPSCAQALHDLGIRKIAYTTDGGYVEENFYKQEEKPNVAQKKEN